MTSYSEAVEAQSKVDKLLDITNGEPYTFKKRPCGFWQAFLSTNGYDYEIIFDDTPIRLVRNVKFKNITETVSLLNSAYRNGALSMISK